MRVFAPGFGAGAVAGYAVLWVDPSICVPEAPAVPGVPAHADGDGDGNRARSTTVDDVKQAFN
jgi:hypothetical protein